MPELAVVEGAVLRCTAGLNPCPLKVTTPFAPSVDGKPAASIDDHKSGDNIETFVLCSITHKPCKPQTPEPWPDGGFRSSLSPSLFPTLTEGAILLCREGGLISIEDPGQNFYDLYHPDEVALKSEIDDLNREMIELGIQTGLDVVGIFEPTPFADLASAGMSLRRGDYGGALLSGASALFPYAGDAIAKPLKGAKLAKRVAQLKKRLARAKDLDKTKPWNTRAQLYEQIRGRAARLRQAAKKRADTLREAAKKRADALKEAAKKRADVLKEAVNEGASTGHVRGKHPFSRPSPSRPPAVEAPPRRPHELPFGRTIDEWLAALGKPNAPPLVRQRLETALEFLQERFPNMPAKKIKEEFLMGMDLSQEVRQGTLPAGTEVIAHVTPPKELLDGTKVISDDDLKKILDSFSDDDLKEILGLFYSKPGTAINRLGIDPGRRVYMRFRLKEAVTALESRTTGIRDEFTLGRKQPKSLVGGGGIQYIIPDTKGLVKVGKGDVAD